MDAVTKPQHYQAGGIETIEVIRAKLGPEGFGYYCEGNVRKYLDRWRHKDGVRDLRKAQVYLDWLLTEAQIKPPAYEEQAVAHHATEAPMPPAMAARLDLHAEDDTPEVAINWETAREHADGAA